MNAEKMVNNLCSFDKMMTVSTMVDAGDSQTNNDVRGDLCKKMISTG